jgi:hypothetical protein
LQGNIGMLSRCHLSALSRILRPFPGGYGRRQRPSAFLPGRPVLAHGAGDWTRSRSHAAICW